MKLLIYFFEPECNRLQNVREKIYELSLINTIRSWERKLEIEKAQCKVLRETTPDDAKHIIHMLIAYGKRLSKREERQRLDNKPICGGYPQEKCKHTAHI